jgi:quercetin dioxygenase-like cupin family protein
MQIFPYDSVKLEEVEIAGASKVKVRWLITKEIGAEHFAMRVFEIEPLGYTPMHTHPWEHEIFILEGKGQTFDKKNTMPITAGDVVFVPPNEWHQFQNIGEAVLKFICLIPYSKE